MKKTLSLIHSALKKLKSGLFVLWLGPLIPIPSGAAPIQSFELVPEELGVEITSYLSLAGLLGLGQTQTRLRSLVKSVASGDHFAADLSYRKIPDKTFKALFSQNGILHHVKNLNLSHAKFNECCLKHLPPHLKTLNLSWTRVGDAGIAELVQAVPNLAHLNISKIRIKKCGVQQIAWRLHDLETLDISLNQIRSDGAAILANLKNLQKLDISLNSIGTEGAARIADNLPLLQVLNISSNQIGLEGVKQISEKLSHLRILDVSVNPIHEEGARLLLRGLTQLKAINLYGLGRNNRYQHCPRVNLLFQRETFGNPIWKAAFWPG